MQTTSCISLQGRCGLVRIQHSVTTAGRDLEYMAGSERWFVQSGEEVTEIKVLKIKVFEE